MGIEGVTVHGFRSTFRDWAVEHTHHHPEVVDMALAHSVGNMKKALKRHGSPEAITTDGLRTRRR